MLDGYLVGDAAKFHRVDAHGELADVFLIKDKVGVSRTLTL